MEKINYLDLKGKVVIVTGSTRGIGRTCALLLAKSTFFMSRAVLPAMKEHGSGKIINIASIADISGIGIAPYVAVKSGLIGLAKALAQELGRYSITVDAIAPGLTHTDRTHNVYKKDYFW